MKQNLKPTGLDLSLVALALLVLTTGWLTGCSSSTPAASTPDYAADAAGLETLFEDLLAARESGRTEAAVILTRGLLPDAADLDFALRDDSGDASVKIAALIAGFAAGDDSKVAALLSCGPEETEIQVHAATTEALRAYEEGTPAFNEFPGGAKQLAETVLAPGLTFYEVEFVEPGEDLGTKFHLFFHDGTSWKTLGPAWRALR